LQKINTIPNQASPLPADPLALKDIHLPEQISNFPIAYGWWLLTALLLLLLLITAIKIKKSSQRNRIKKEALTQLKNNLELNNNDLISLLKWAAIHYFPRNEVAKLYGDSLQQFFLQQLPEKHQVSFNNLSEEVFKNQYQPNFHCQLDQNFHQATRLWLTHALPPNSAIQENKKSANSDLNQKNNGAGA